MKAYSQWMGVNERQAMGNKKPSQNWDDLRYFLAVARAGTLSAAAKQLGTEHTTVARHIQAVEDELKPSLPQDQQRLWTDRRGRTASGRRRGNRERLRFRQGGREQRRTADHRDGSHRRTRWVWQRLSGAARAGTRRPAPRASNRDFDHHKAVQPIETRGGYRHCPFESGADARCI